MARIMNIAATVALVYHRRGVIAEQVLLNTQVSWQVQERMMVIREQRQLRNGTNAAEKETKKAQRKAASEQRAAEKRQEKIDTMTVEQRQAFVR